MKPDFSCTARMRLRMSSGMLARSGTGKRLMENASVTLSGPLELHAARLSTVSHRAGLRASIEPHEGSISMNQRKMRIGMSIRGHGYHPAAWRHPDVPAD